MKSIEDIGEFLNAFVTWASAHEISGGSPWSDRMREAKLEMIRISIW